MLESQPADKRGRLQDQFEMLLNNVRNNLDTSNRDRFNQQMQVFRLRVRSFIAV